MIISKELVGVEEGNETIGCIRQLSWKLGSVAIFIGGSIKSYIIIMDASCSFFFNHSLLGTKFQREYILEYIYHRTDFVQYNYVP